MMGNDITLEFLLKLHQLDTAEELMEYINYLEDVKADYEYLKAKIKCVVNEIDSLY